MSPVGHGPNVAELVIERVTLRDSILKTLKSAILRGQLAPGERLTEKVLSDSLKVSRAPLREAFLKLEEEGLVTKTPHRGAIVTAFAVKDIIDIYSVRIPLEGFAARLVAEQLSQDAEMASIVFAYNNLLEKGETGNVSDYLAADFEFHRTIWKGGGNHKLERMLTQLCTPLFGFNLIQAVGQGKSFSTQQAAREHQPIVEALKEHKPDLAEKVMRDTIAWNRREYISRCWNQAEAK